jgi:hypothetical protein
LQTTTKEQITGVIVGGAEFIGTNISRRGANR